MVSNVPLMPSCLARFYPEFRSFHHALPLGFPSFHLVETVLATWKATVNAVEKPGFVIEQLFDTQALMFISPIFTRLWLGYPT